MPNDSSKLWRLLSELEREISRLEDENNLLKEKIKQCEEQKQQRSPSPVKRVEWVELEPGKRFLTKKGLGKYPGMGAGTISKELG